MVTAHIELWIIIRVGSFIEYIKAIYPSRTKVLYQALQLISCLNNFCFYPTQYYMVFAWHCEIFDTPSSVHSVVLTFF